MTSRIRLVDGPTENSGRVEIYREGEWGTICDDQWEEDEAIVACRQLGFFGLGRLAAVNEFGGVSTDSPILYAVDCSGSQSSLEECEFGEWDTGRCTHREDVSVVCQTGTT